MVCDEFSAIYFSKIAPDKFSANIKAQTYV